MSDFSDPPVLSGSLLVASPSLNDPHFSRTVVLLSAHSEDDGALGVILNRPVGKTLGELFPDHGFAGLSEVEVFEGGPVQDDQLVLAAWRWDEDGKMFKMFFGISREKAEDLLDEDGGVVVRGFLGYAGWSAGQLENEIMGLAWMPCPIARSYFEPPHDESYWHRMLTIAREAEVSAARSADPGDDLPDPPADIEWN